MALLNTTDLFSSIVPTALISKITLENRTTGLPEHENNPHIDLSRSLNAVIDARTGARVYEFTEGDLSAKPEEDNNLFITLDIMLKEKLDDGLVGRWFANQEFSKYLKIKVSQITNKSVYEKVIKSANSIYSFLSQEKASGTEQEIKTIISSIETKDLSVARDVLGDNSNLTNKYTELDNNGDEVVSFSFRTSFEINKNFDYLAYVIFSYLDIEAIVRDFSLLLGTNDIQPPIGKVSADVVIENGVIVSQTITYFTPEGNIWVGAVGFDENGGVIALDPNGFVFPLTKKVVDNAKIQDFRNFKEIERLSLDFSFIENNLIKESIINGRIDNLIHQKEKSGAFSNVFLSRAVNGNARFFFSINFGKLVELFSVYGSLFNRPFSTINDASILGMKIVRRRIGGSPEIGSKPNKNILFDDNQVDDVVVVSGEKEKDTFQTKNNDKGSIQEIKDVVMPQTQDTLRLRHFSGVDKEMGDITDGYYQYGVELEITDPSFVYLRNRLLEIVDAKKRLKEYYDEASQLTTNETLVSNSNPHIDFPGERKVDLNTITPGNFDAYANRFTQKFINKMLEKYPNSVEAPWVKPIKFYLDVLNILTKKDVDVLKYEKPLMFLAHPVSGNLTGIEFILRLIQDLETSLSKVVSLQGALTSNQLLFASVPVSVLGEKLNNSVKEPLVASKKESSLKKFKVSYFFPDIFNSNISNSVGYDYLGINEDLNNITSIKTISGQQYRERVEKETDIYFSRPDGQKPNINIILGDKKYTTTDTIDGTSFSYLSPATMNMGGNFKLKRIGSSPTPKFGPEIYSSVKSTIQAIQNNDIASINRISVMGTNLVLGIDNNALAKNYENHFAPQGLSTGRNTQNPTLSVGPRISLNFARGNSNIDNITKEALSCLLNNVVAPVNAIPLLSSLTKKTINETIQSFDIASTQNSLSRLINDASLIHAESFFQGERHSTTLNQAISALPNQIKSLFLARSNPNIVKTNYLSEKTDVFKSPEKQTEFSLHYRMLSTILVLDGYEESSFGDVLLKKPNWVPLTLEIYNKARGENLLCRQRPYENKIIGIERDEELELPLYDKYFILKTEIQLLNRTSLSVNPVQIDIIAPELTSTHILTNRTSSLARTNTIIPTTTDTGTSNSTLNVSAGVFNRRT